MINKSTVLVGICLTILVIFISTNYKYAYKSDLINTKKIEISKQPYSKQDLISDLNKILRVNNSFSVYIHNLDTNEKIEINSTEKFQAASVTKILVAVNALIRSEKNKTTKEYILNKVSIMINQSNNNAWDILNSMIGFDNLQRFANTNNIEGTNIYDNQMTTRGVGILLADIYEGKYIKPESLDFLLKQMTDTNNEKMLPASVPENITVYHKTGTYLGNIHDAGIVMHEFPYIIVVFTDDNRDISTEMRMESIKSAANKVYQYYTM